MRLLYTCSIALYVFGIRVAALFNNKAKLWVSGRSDLWQELSAKSEQLHGCTWIHCASLGEFEQGRSIIESIKANNPEHKVLLTFFSPSGYEVRKNYAGADHICYLPPDFTGNSKRFIELVQPQRVLFVKYEFWFNLLAVLHQKKIDTYLVSGIFREKQHFFKAYGGWFKKQLKVFTHFFLQNQKSVE